MAQHGSGQTTKQTPFIKVALFHNFIYSNTEREINILLKCIYKKSKKTLPTEKINPLQGVPKAQNIHL